MNKKNTKITPINWIDDSNQYALIPGHNGRKKIRRIKALKKKKGNCYFAHGVSRDLIDFIYRAIIQLKLKDKSFIFSRGAVKQKGRSVVNAVGIKEMNWDLGTSIRIPHRLNYNHRIALDIGNEEYKLRLMELIVLSCLLHNAYPAKTNTWCTDMAARVITKGWSELRKK